jgi:hypothetical protein
MKHRTSRDPSALPRWNVKGCGFVNFRFSTFASEANREQILRWRGGYFQWETAGKSTVRWIGTDQGGLDRYQGG